VSFTDYFHLLVTGREPTPAATAVLNATLVAIAEHGLVPSVQASRMTLAAAPDALQGAVAAGILGCGSVILGASETCGIFLDELRRRAGDGKDYDTAARQVVAEYRSAKRAIPGYGHPLHKARDPRVTALFNVAEKAGADMSLVENANVVEQVCHEDVDKKLMLYLPSANPAVLLGAGFPLSALRGVPILARTAGLIRHLTEDFSKPIGFALSYQATRNYVYDGEVPEGYTDDRD